LFGNVSIKLSLKTPWDWRYGLSGREPALGVQSPKLKPHQKQKAEIFFCHSLIDLKKKLASYNWHDFNLHSLFHEFLNIFLITF
jgi:hypothetical protein